MSSSFTRLIGLTKLEFIPDHPMTINLITDQYALHQSVYELVKNDDGRSRILYRLETALDAYQRVVPSVLIQHRPEISPKMDARILSCCTCTTKSSFLELQENHYYYFRLRANPVKSMDLATRGARGKKVELGSDEERQEWLKRKFRERSVTLESVNMVKEPETRMRKYVQGKRNDITIAGVLYNGVMKVEDPDNAISLLSEGLGRAKGFGFGLLSVAAVR